MDDVETIIEGLSVTEKANIVTGQEFWYTYGDAGKHVRSIMMTDGPSGLRKQAQGADALGLNHSVQAVCFPSAALTASSFNPDLMTQLGEHLGRAAQAEDVSVLLGPGVNIKRSPLAGRNFEYFSEDPYLAGMLGTAYVQGVQSQGVGVSVKHFAANNRENQRFTATSNVDERALREIYLAVFERIVKRAHPATLMCSYNAINGTLNSQNQRLLTDILRNEWGFDGLVMSDWGAVADRVKALQAGLDLEMPGRGHQSVNEIVTAVEDGQLDEGQLNRAVRRVLTLTQRWGIHTNSTHTYDKEQQHQFARRLAADGMILLKNRQHVLPLNEKDKIAVIGELAVKPRYQGGGSSHVNAYRLSKPLEELQHRMHATYAQGYELTQTSLDNALLNEAITVGQKAEKIVVFAGFPAAMESEGYDKESLALPHNQVVLIQELCQLGKPVIVVLQNGSVVEVPWIDDVDGLLETYLAGEAVGEATADVLLGEVNPSGKLAETFPLVLQDNPTYGTFNVDPTREDYHEGIFVGYRYYDMKQLPVRFPFGYGLSYTQFRYQQLQTAVNGTDVTVTVQLTNIGDRSGQETVELYVSNQASRIEKEIRTLRAVRKVLLSSGETQTVVFHLHRRDFSWYNPKVHHWQCDAGTYDIQVGQSVRQIITHELVTISETAKPMPVTMSTYIGDLKQRPDLTDALIRSGVKSAIDQLENDSDSARLLENMPLRAANMIGLDFEQVQTFIRLANQIS